MTPKRVILNILFIYQTHMLLITKIHSFMNIVYEKAIMDEIVDMMKFYFSQDYKFFSDCYKAGYKVSIINKKLYLLNMEIILQ